MFIYSPVHWPTGESISHISNQGLKVQIFPRFLYFALLNIHRRFNITNITPHSPDDGSLEPKRYSVDFASQ